MKYRILHAPLVRSAPPTIVRGGIRLVNNEYAEYREVSTVEADSQLAAFDKVKKDPARYCVTKEGNTLIEVA